MKEVIWELLVYQWLPGQFSKTGKCANLQHLKEADAMTALYDMLEKKKTA